METIEDNLMEQKMQPMLLTIAQAALELAVSKRTIYRLIKSGQITPIHLTADAPRIRRQDLERLIGLKNS